MAIYDLSGIGVLLVEDNGFVRNILEGLLQHFRVGRVVSATSGEEAIEILSSPAFSANIDIVLSDLVMSPINGLLLLRWVRGSKDSPNRFMPFVMISGAADRDNVTEARDLGMTEFVAKPFSAESVYRRILEVIDHPRQYIATAAYFGPERRRRDVGRSGADRRRTKEEEITIVRSSGDVARTGESSRVWYFRLTNTLRQKVTGGGIDMGAGEMPMALLSNAEEELQRNALDFTEWARTYLRDLSAHCDRAREDPTARARQMEEINLLAHELRGQGGTFGYPLITTFAKSLYEATGDGCRVDDSAVEIVKAHIDAMRAVIRDKVAGNGGDIGKALLAGLTQAKERNSEVI